MYKLAFAGQSLTRTIAVVAGTLTALRETARKEAVTADSHIQLMALVARRMTMFHARRNLATAVHLLACKSESAHREIRGKTLTFQVAATPPTTVAMGVKTGCVVPSRPRLRHQRLRPQSKPAPSAQTARVDIEMPTSAPARSTAPAVQLQATVETICTSARIC